MGADLVVVKTTFMDVDIVNEVAFIDQVISDPLGLPYVVNLSLGSHEGPHDGTDLMSQTLNVIAGPGKPGKTIVAAAGNEGTDGIHASGNVGNGIAVNFNVPGAVSDGLPAPFFSFADVWYGAQETLTFGFIDPTGAGVEGIPAGVDTGIFCNQAPPDTTVCLWILHTDKLPENNSKNVAFLILGPDP